MEILETQRGPQMQTLEYRTIDKSSWGEGPWQSEPDKKQWRDAATGLPCLIVRGPSGALCGYVGVDRHHPAYQQEYDHASVNNVAVHGGLTFSDKCRPGAEDRGICHNVGAGEDDDIWWFGFDCAHCLDTSPAYDRSWSARDLEEEYRDMQYVENEIANLARQLANLSSSETQ